MDSNRRAAYRVPLDIDAQVVAGGKSRPVKIQNLSAGGAMFDADDAFAAGRTVQLRMDLSSEWVKATGFDQVIVDLELIDVFEVRESSDDATGTDSDAEPAQPTGPVIGFRHRARSLAVEGSPEFEKMHKLVFAAERHRLSKRTGAGQASPMASDPERRAARRRNAGGDRFGRGAINPLHDD